MNKKLFGIAAFVVLGAAILIAAGTRSNTWYIGDGTAGLKQLIFRIASGNQNPGFRYNDTSGKIEKTDDGSTFEEVVAAPPGASTFQYGETLAVGDGLEVRSDGKAYKVTRDPGPSNEVLATAGTDNRFGIAHDPSTDEYMAVGNSASSFLATHTLSVSNSVLSVGPQVFGPSIGTNAGAIGCSDENQQKAVVVVGENTGNRAYLADISGGVITLGNNTQDISDAFAGPLEPHKCIYDPISQKVILLYYSGAFFISKVQLINNQSGTPVFETALNVGTGAGTTFDIEFDPVNNRYLILYEISGSLAVNILDTTSGSAVLSGDNLLGPTAVTQVSLGYDEANGGWIAFYRNTSGNWTAQPFAFDGVSITPGGAGVVYKALVQQGQSDLETWYDDATDKLYHYGVRFGEYYTFTSDGTTATLTSTNTSNFANGTSVIAFTADPYTSETYVVETTGSSKNAQVFTVPNGSAQGEKFIAVAKEAGVLNDEKEITLAGPVVSGFAGQTPGTKAYLQDDSTITTAVSDFEVGTFISATDLAVTKLPEAPEEDVDLVTEYQKVSLNLSTDPTFTSGVCEIERINKTVTVTCTAALHSTTSSAVTALGFLPEFSRPVSTTQNLYNMSATEIFRIVTYADGRLQFNYRNFSGGTNSRGGTGSVASISYTVP